jgi:hypothetical protein
VRSLMLRAAAASRHVHSSLKFLAESNMFMFHRGAWIIILIMPILLGVVRCSPPCNLRVNQENQTASCLPAPRPMGLRRLSGCLEYLLPQRASGCLPATNPLPAQWAAYLQRAGQRVHAKR